MPPDMRSGPQVTTPGAASNADGPATSPNTTRRVTCQPAATAYVSLYAPAGRRTWWWYSYRCPTCGTYQLGRSQVLTSVTRQRKGGCGHLLAIVIARTYGAAA